MGFYKNLEIQLSGEGIDIHSYLTIGNKMVCYHCFEDYAIKNFIKENADKRFCDYCNSRSNYKISISIYEVVKFIVEGIRFEWDIPENCMGWCSQEGGWIGETIDKYDLIHDELNLGVENPELLRDITDLILNFEWCPQNPYHLSPDEKMFYGWMEFSEIIKHHVRYFFIGFLKKEEISAIEKRPYLILTEIGKNIKKFNLIKTLPAGSEIIRVRLSDELLNSSAKELGPPPKQKTIYSNRMSPAGIPMFYGSMDEETAIAETLDKKNPKKYLYIAKFKTLKNLKLVDLTNLPDLPSLFDRDKRYLRVPLKFLHSFLLDFSKPIKRDGREHIEYVPTQIVTEYFRHIFKINNRRIDGIIYPSAARKNGKSCVLFCDSEKCTDLNELKTESKNENKDKWLILDVVKRNDNYTGELS